MGKSENPAGESITINYERMIRNALGQMTAPDTGLRLRVYRSAMDAFEKKFGESDPEALKIHRGLLGEAIQKIEADYKFEADSLSAMESELSALDTGGEWGDEAAQTPVVAEQADTLSKSQTASKAPSPAANKGNAVLKIAGLVAILAAALMLVGILFLYFFREAPAPILIKAQREAPLSSLEQVGTTTIFSAEFPENINEFSNKLSGTAGQNGSLEMASANAVRLGGLAAIYGSELIEIDPSKTYSVRIEARFIQKVSTTKPPIINIGFATFDADKTLQKDPPGTHRYFVNFGEMKDAARKDKNGWFELVGTIQGVGNQSHNTFRPGSRFAKFAMSYNMRSVDQELQLKSIQIQEIE